VVVEVLSPSTAALDEGPKFDACKVISTLRDYLLVSQEEPRVTHYTRLEGGDWEPRGVNGLDASLELESTGCALKLRDIYDGVPFPP
jgi:Uma2 family endonuclease